jgi:hypothetical protein
MPYIASRSDRTFFVREMGEVRLPTALLEADRVC